MKKFTVVAQVHFDVYAEDADSAIRQTDYALGAFVNKDENAIMNYEADYPEKAEPEFIPGNFQITDDEGVVVKNGLHRDLSGKPEVVEESKDSEDK